MSATDYSKLLLGNANASGKIKNSQNRFTTETNLKQKEAKDVPLVEFMYLVFTRMPGESYRRRLRSLLLYLCYVFRALINSIVC